MIPLQQDKDKTGKRFLTCYLFPQDLLRGDSKQSFKSNKSNLKTNIYRDIFTNDETNTLASLSADAIEEQNYYDRQHLIRFTGDSNNSNVNNTNVSIMCFKSWFEIYLICVFSNSQAIII